MAVPSLARDSLFNGLAFVVRSVGVTIAMAWVARSLGPEGQGRFGFAHWIAAILAQASLWGLGVTSTRFVARALGAKDPQGAKLAVELATRWLLMTLVPVATLVTSVVWFWGGELRAPLLASIPMMVTIALYQWRLGVTWGLRRFDIALAGYTLFFLVLLLLLPFSLGHSSPIIATLLLFGVARGLHAAFLWVWTSRVMDQLVGASPPRDSSNFSLEELVRSMRGYALQMAVVAFFGALLWERIALPFIKAASGFEQVGFYTAAFGVSILFLRVPGVLAQVVLPVAAELEGAGADSEVLGSMFRRTARFITLLVAPPVAILWVAAPEVVEALFGTAYAESADLLRVLLLPLFLSGTAAAGAKILVGAGRQDRLLRIVSLAASLKLILCLTLIPSYGALGGAISVAISWGLAMLFEGLSAGACFPERASSSSPPRWRNWMALVGVTLGTAGASFLGSLASSELSLALSIPAIGLAGAFGAAASTLLLKPLETGDIDALTQTEPLLKMPRLAAWLRRTAR